MPNPFALVLIDLQNEFCKPGGKLHDEVKELMEKQDMLKKVKEVVAAARKAKGLVIHSPVVMKAGEKYNETDFDPKHYTKMPGLFTEGTWNCEIIDELKPIPNSEIVLEGRNDFSAFGGTQLESILKKRGVKNLYLAGFMTNLCIEETARAAVERFPGMRVTVLVDGCAAKTAKEHNLVSQATLPIFCETMACSDFVTQYDKPSCVTM